MGGDDSVVAAARVSNGADYSTASKGPEADQKLINYLVKHRHGTPFEHNAFQFYVKVPLFVRSEWHRHRIGWSYNEISGRYVEFEYEVYIPELFRVPGTTNKQGSTVPQSGEEIKSNPALFRAYPGQYGVNQWNNLVRRYVERSCKESYDVYKTLLAAGVAKEMARMVLPQNMYTQFYATCNARSLMHFLNLRAATDAQWEIRQYALAMKDMFKEAMPQTYQAWEDNDLIAP